MSKSTAIQLFEGQKVRTQWNKIPNDLEFLKCERPKQSQTQEEYHNYQIE